MDNPEAGISATSTRRKERGHECRRIDFRARRLGRDRKSGIQAGESNLTSFDAVIVRTMPPGSLEQVVYRMDALWRLEAAGVVVLNPPKAVECAVDKYLASVRLESAGLTVPPRSSAKMPRRHSRRSTAWGATSSLNQFRLRRAGDRPRQRSGSGPPHVSDLERIGAVLYVQQFIENEGFDVRVMVLDGRMLGAMRRRANGDFRRTFVPGDGRAICARTRMRMALGAAEATGSSSQASTCFTVATGRVMSSRSTPSPVGGISARDGPRRGGRGDLQFAIVGQRESSMDVNGLTAPVAAHAARAPLVAEPRPPIA